MSQISSPPPVNVNKKFFSLAFVLLLLCALGVAVFMGTRLYATAKQEYLAEQHAMLLKDVRDTVISMSTWQEDIRNQASRVSSSELFRLFAKEAHQLQNKDLRILNEAEHIPQDGSDVAILSEQVPLMRNVLLDFINYVGFTDARVVTEQGQNIISAHTRPTALLSAQADVIRHGLSQASPALGVVRMGPNTTLLLDFVDPLQAILSGEGRDAPVAALMLTIPITGHVGRFLSHENRLLPDANLALLQKHGNMWENIRVQGITPLNETAQQALNPDAAGNVAFGLHLGINGKDMVYALGVPVPDTPWLVLAEIPAGLVHATLEQKARSITIMCVLGYVGFTLLLPLLWWLFVGRGQHAMALRFKELYHTIQQQKQLLDSVNMSLKVGLFMVDGQGEIQLANPAFADIVQEEETALPGKTLFILFAGTSAEKLLAGITHVLKNNSSMTLEVERENNNATSIYRTTLFPFVDTNSGAVTGVVGTMQDITEFRHRAAQQQRQQMQTMSAFMRAIESIDPYLAGHSQMMHALGKHMSRQLALNDADTRTIDAATELSQVGKLSLPQELLRKDGALTEDELAELRRVPQYAHAILKDISFDLPVAEAVYAMNERMDGKGYPRGLQGEEICQHARILAVLNAFCAMISPRSYREGLSEDKALELLAKNPSFDPVIVNALQEVLRTSEGAEALRQAKKKL